MHTAASRLCKELTALGNQTVDELVQLYNRMMTAARPALCNSDSATQSQQEDDVVFDADCRAARSRARALGSRETIQAHVI